jgi:hypothetical protein
MNTTRNRESTHRFGSLTKLATRAVLTGGVGLAAMGLAAGIANATPAQPAITCPDYYVIGHQGGEPFTVELAQWPEGGKVTVHEGGPSGTPVGQSATVDSTMAAATTEYWYLPVTVNDSGDTLTAVEVVGSQTLQASCHIQVHFAH